MSAKKVFVQTKLSFTKKDSTEDTGSLKRKHSGGSEPDMSSDKDERKSLSLKRYQSCEEKSLDRQNSTMKDDEQQARINDSYDEGDDSAWSQEAKFWTGQQDDAGTWGCPFKDLPQAPTCFKQELPVLRNNPPNHYVFFIPNSRLQHATELPSYPGGEFEDNWGNDNYVRMPCSRCNKIADCKGLVKRIRWEVIETSLKEKDIFCSMELEEAILSYNSHYKSKWNFDALHHYFRKLTEIDKDIFFKTTLKEMVKLALALPRLFTKAVPFLKQNKESDLTLSQQQVACLLANAFFCTFPNRNLNTRGGLLPNINFSSLFSGPCDSQRFSKLKCIMHYFKRVTTKMPAGVVTYSRRVLREDVDWEFDDQQLTKLHMASSGTIEDYGRGMLQADFANKYVGGGVLGHGCVQEEIRFLICPEMIVSRLFTEVLLEKEVLVMTGCERFSAYKGYSKSFEWDGDFEDTTKRDEWGRRYTEVVAMDALSLKGYQNQFSKQSVTRELNKAYCAFKEMNRDSPTAICTGNWGCGAFGGDVQLKALIQIIAASKANRDVCYLAVGDKDLCRNLSKVHKSLMDGYMTIANLFQVIMEYSKHCNGSTTRNLSLYEYYFANYGIS